jgi:hypothetical protein
MPSYALAEVSIEQLGSLCELQHRGVNPGLWDDRPLGDLTEDEQSFVATLRKHLVPYSVQLANEATIWARAIYPLLLLAEQDDIRAFSGLPLRGQFPGGELRGEVDGAMAHIGIQADAQPPYLVVVEAKRGVEAHDPVAQLLAGLLCAALKNHKKHPRAEQRLYGAYTVADVWTFIQATVTGLDDGRPAMTTIASREYTEKAEASLILRLLKSMVAELLAANRPS